MRPRAESSVTTTLEMELDAERLAQPFGAEHVAELAGGDHPAGAHQHGVGQRRRDIFDMMGDDDEWGSAGVRQRGGRAPRRPVHVPPDRALRTARRAARPRARSSASEPAAPGCALPTTTSSTHGRRASQPPSGRGTPAPVRRQLRSSDATTVRGPRSEPCAPRRMPRGWAATGRRGPPTRIRCAAAAHARRSARAVHRAPRRDPTSGARRARRCGGATSCRSRSARAAASAAHDRPPGRHRRGWS